MTNLIRRSLAALLALTLFLPVSARAVEDLWDYSTTASSNTNLGGVSMAEGMLPGILNDGIRELLEQLKRGVYNKGTDIASAATTNICATGTSHQAHITGTTTITSFGTAAAGCWRIVTFDGALTLTHNATSLIIPGATNITTVAGDVVGVISEGSGNWRVVFLSRVPYLGVANTFTAAQTISLTAAGTALTLLSTDAGATAGPVATLTRDSASPAAFDLLGAVQFNGEDSGGTSTLYGSLSANNTDPTDTSEDGQVRIGTVVAGSFLDRVIVGQGVQIGTPTSGDKGSGTVNAAAGVYVNGHGTVAQFVEDTDNTYQTAGTILPFDDSIPQNTEGDEILSVAITPVNASSTLLIIPDVQVSLAVANGTFSCAIFVDSTAGALSARAGSVGTTDRLEGLSWHHTLSAGSTSARTYKLRCGSATATDLKVNGDSTTRIFGGVAVSSLRVIEILPQ